MTRENSRNRKGKDDSVDLNTNASALINGGFIHYWCYVHAHKCGRWWCGNSTGTFNYNAH